MEERALEIIKTMLKRRNPEANIEVQDVVIEKVTQGTQTPGRGYLVGDVLVIFTSRAKLLEQEIRSIQAAIASSQYSGNYRIIVSLSPPSENVEKYIKSLAKTGAQFFHIRELQFDLPTHRMYMPHRILNEDERTAVFNNYKVSNPEAQLPWIDSQDPPIRWIGAKPGDVVEVTRHSDSAGNSVYYRYVVEDVNIAQ
jgi:DNA-directed RNA polymerase subunit H (RpoH/RPB5)